MINLQFVHEKCVEANPATIVNKHAQIIHQDHSVEYFEQHRPIRLADVLLAWKDKKADWKKGEDTTIHGIVSIVDCWNLRKDDLNEQSPETITFLASLLQ